MPGLLLDLDRALPGYTTVYGSYATMDLTYDIKSGSYMAQGLLRHWVHPETSDQVLAVNIAFWNEKVKLSEPFFIAAKLLYREPLSTKPDNKKAWDPWYCYFDWTPDREPDVLKQPLVPSKRSDLLCAASIGVPLESVSTATIGKGLLERVRDFQLSDHDLPAA